MQEFYDKTGKLLLLYSSEGFVSKFNELNPGSIDHEAVKEIENINNYSNFRHVDVSDGKGYFYFDFYENIYSSSEKIDYLKKILSSISRLIDKYNSKMIENDKEMLFRDLLECSNNIQNYYIDSYKRDFDDIVRKSFDLEKYISFHNYNISYDVSLDIEYLLRRIIRMYR